MRGSVHLRDVILVVLFVVSCMVNVEAFSTPSVKNVIAPSSTTVYPHISSLQMESKTQLQMFVADASDVNNFSSLVTQSSQLILAETDPWVQPLSLILGPILNLMSFAMLCRVVISWYPSVKLNELPFSLAVWPTELLLRSIRGVIPPAFGVDITPIVWLGIFSFLNEILLGQQGLLTLKMKYGI